MIQPCHIPQIVELSLEWSNSISPFFWHFLYCVATSIFVHPMQFSVCSSEAFHVFYWAHYLMHYTVLCIENYHDKSCSCPTKGLNVWLWFVLCFGHRFLCLFFTVSQFLMQVVSIRYINCVNLKNSISNFQFSLKGRSIRWLCGSLC
jgi:hypothetical protein